MEQTTGPVSGTVLRRERQMHGIAQQDLAAAIGIHRTRVFAWERAETVDTVRAARYRRALDQLVREATS